MALTKLFVLSILVACVAAAVPADQHEEQQLLLGAKSNPRQSFWQWMAKHERSYANDVQEFEHRFRVWLDNLEYILDYNSKHTSHWLGLNALADLTHEEYKSKYALGFNKYERPLGSRPNSFMYADVAEDTMPPQVDWRELKAVAEVKNQMNCGSCWAFSTTGAVEGINAIVTKKLVSLSEQELVDCDTSKDKGCSGGLMDFAFEYIIKKGGLHSEKSYPYTGQDGECLRENTEGVVVTIDGYEDVPPMDEISLKKAVSHQPVSVAIQADQRPFQLYMGGVFDDEDCGQELDHGVLVVGYGVESKPSGEEAEVGRHHNYWIVKNSWGAGWGESGYIRIRMGRGKSGLCGVAMQPSYPTKKGPNPPAPEPKPSPKPAPTPPPAPGPEPEPVECDATSECPPATTCCCIHDLAGFCFTWGCCPMEGATCCEDKEHCCPSDLPVCDTDSGRCMPKPSAQRDGFAPEARWAPWATKLPATRKVPNSWWAAGKRDPTRHTIQKPLVS